MAYYGGTTNGVVIHWPKVIKATGEIGVVIHWPKVIKATGEIRPQYHHLIDIAPTVLEAAKLPQPGIVNGTPPEANRRCEHGLHLQ